MATIRFLGGAEEIGASSAVLEMDGARLLVDCGVRMQGPLGERLPHLAALEEEGAPQAVLVTHAHLDHIGALPVLSQRFSEIPVYATPPTIALMRIQLLDALKVMEADAEAEGEIPLYSRAAVEALLARTFPVKPYTPFEPVPGKPPRAVFFLSGHILGAASVGLEGPSGRVLFTGDLSTQNQRTIPGMSAPRFRPHLVVTESTYGARLHAARAAEEERLVRMVAETIAGRGKVLFPAFAIGRAQEIILILIQAMLTRKLPPFPVHVDGLVRNVCGVYHDFGEYLQPRLKRRIQRFGDPFFDVLENVRPVAGEKRRLEILDGPPCAVVASSGMLTGGASPIYARALVHGPEHLIAITGYQDEESPGRRLLEAAEGRTQTIPLGGRDVQVRCRVEKYALSAHSDGNGLAGLIRALGPSDTLLVHGSAEAREELAGLLLRERLGRVHLPRRNGAYRFLLSGGGTGGRVLVSGIGKGPLDAGSLRQHLLRTYREGASFTASELFRAWHGKDPSPAQADALGEELRVSGLFEPDPARPFHLAPVSEPAAPQAPAVLEQNELLRRLDAVLPPAARLLRKSFQPGVPHLELHFAFPDIAGERYRQLLEDAFAGTGWTYSIAPEANHQAVQALIAERVPDRGLLARPASVHLGERRATAWLGRPLAPEEAAAWEAAAREVEEQSGFQVSFESRPAPPAPRKVRDAQGRMEINLAYRRIAEAFEGAPERPLRVGLHPGKSEAHIRLTFITPEVGERYRDVLDRLREETGWELRIDPAPDQNAVVGEARRLVEPLGKIRRGPRFLFKERAVEVEVEIAASVPGDLTPEFQRRTAYTLRVIPRKGPPR